MGNGPSDWAGAGLFIWTLCLADLAAILILRMWFGPQGHWLIRGWTYRISLAYTVLCGVLGLLMLVHAG